MLEVKNYCPLDKIKFLTEGNPPGHNLGHYNLPVTTHKACSSPLLSMIIDYPLYCGLIEFNQILSTIDMILFETYLIHKGRYQEEEFGFLSNVPLTPLNGVKIN